jgi:hypothetical protein
LSAPPLNIAVLASPVATGLTGASAQSAPAAGGLGAFDAIFAALFASTGLGAGLDTGAGAGAAAENLALPTAQAFIDAGPATQALAQGQTPPGAALPGAPLTPGKPAADLGLATPEVSATQGLPLAPSPDTGAKAAILPADPLLLAQSGLNQPKDEETKTATDEAAPAADPGAPSAALIAALVAPAIIVPTQAAPSAAPVTGGGGAAGSPNAKLPPAPPLGTPLAAADADSQPSAEPAQSGQTPDLLQPGVQSAAPPRPEAPASAPQTAATAAATTASTPAVLPTPPAPDRGPDTAPPTAELAASPPADVAAQSVAQSASAAAAGAAPPAGASAAPVAGKDKASAKPQLAAGAPATGSNEVQATSDVATPAAATADASARQPEAHVDPAPQIEAGSQENKPAAAPEQAVQPAPQPPLAAESAAVRAPVGASVRGSPETVANLAAQIVKKLGARTTQFDVQLTPAGLGRVDVRVEVGADGRISAAMSFDNPQAAADVKARAADLQRALADAGFDASNGLSFDVAGDPGSGAGGGAFAQDGQDFGQAFRGRAFQAALDNAGDAAQAALSPMLNLSLGAQSGVDVRI